MRMSVLKFTDILILSVIKELLSHLLNPVVLQEGAKTPVSVVVGEGADVVGADVGPSVCTGVVIGCPVLTSGVSPGVVGATVDETGVGPSVSIGVCPCVVGAAVVGTGVVPSVCPGV